MAEKVAVVGVGREGDWMYYVKDGQVWKVPRKRAGVLKGRPQMVVDVGIEMDANYIYFLDSVGDVSRVLRSADGHIDDEDDDEQTDDSDDLAVPAAGPTDARELLYTLFPDLDVPRETRNIEFVQHEAARIFSDINRLDQLRRLSPREF